MTDVVDVATRSRMMSGIRGRDTKPEIFVRRALHSRGIRYSLDGSGLPGRPDLVIRTARIAVFVHGCFWHWHGCSLSKLPSSNASFWLEKLSSNTSRDIVSTLSLISAGWSVAVIWECSMRSKPALAKVDRELDILAAWIKNSKREPFFELPYENN